MVGNEIEVELIARKICRKLKIKHYPYYLCNLRRIANRKQLKLHLRPREMKQAHDKFLEVLGSI